MTTIATQTDFDPTVSLAVGVINPQNETIGAFAQARCNADSINLVFKQVMNIDPALQDILLYQFPHRDSIQHTLIPLPYHSSFHLSTMSLPATNIEPDLKFPSIERVFINLSLPSDPNLSQQLLIPAIANACKRCFPNLKHQDSAFNVTIGSESFRVDGQLSPLARDTQVNLVPKRY